ncbi:unnamed protein product [Pieris brassicae]|uniref:Uncharacterized protein n=1 Tax=Pieris brassicae TaxID=7116 RepID=A0A9P0SC14_PIEBR|nr:unnamed protein product [Pieris brassicae]
MWQKIICFTTFLVVVTAQNGYGHSDAYSSQHFVKHDGHPEVVHGHHGHHDYHVTIILLQYCFNYFFRLLYPG